MARFSAPTSPNVWSPRSSPATLSSWITTHRVAGVREAIEAARATLRYLPPYSPDLNPIELSYSAFKAFLRKCAERTEAALGRRIGQFVRRLSAEACANFFAHAGYAAT